jgi:hypothetical protein
VSYGSVAGLRFGVLAVRLVWIFLNGVMFFCYMCFVFVFSKVGPISLPMSICVQRRQYNREFKLHVSGNGKRQVRTVLAKFSLNVFVSYFLSCVERIIMHCSFKTASSFTLYCLKQIFAEYI